MVTGVCGHCLYFPIVCIYLLFNLFCFEGLLGVFICLFPRGGGCKNKPDLCFLTVRVKGSVGCFRFGIWRRYLQQWNRNELLLVRVNRLQTNFVDNFWKELYFNWLWLYGHLLHVLPPLYLFLFNTLYHFSLYSFWKILQQSFYGNKRIF